MRIAETAGDLPLVVHEQVERDGHLPLLPLFGFQVSGLDGLARTHLPRCLELRRVEAGGDLTAFSSCTARKARFTAPSGRCRCGIEPGSGAIAAGGRAAISADHVMVDPFGD